MPSFLPPPSQLLPNSKAREREKKEETSCKEAMVSTTVRRKLRQAVGLMKDQASFTKAIIFSGEFTGGLETAVLQATTHDHSSPIDDRYVHEILFLVSNSPDSVLLLASLITKRLQRTRNAIVALKLLILVHRLLRGGQSRFENDLRVVHTYGELRLAPKNLRPPTKERPYDLVSFVYDYSLFLEQRMSWFINQSGRLELTISNPSTKLFDSVFVVLPKCQAILDGMIRCFPGPAMARKTKLVQSAVDVVLRESFHLYATFEESVTRLAGLVANRDSFGIQGLSLDFAMSILRRASEQNYELVSFFESCRKVCSVRCEGSSPKVRIVISREDIVKMEEKMSSCVMVSFPVAASGESAAGGEGGGRSSSSSSWVSLMSTSTGYPATGVNRPVFSHRWETKVSTEWVVFGDDAVVEGGEIDSSCWRGNPFVDGDETSHQSPCQYPSFTKP